MSFSSSFLVLFVWLYSFFMFFLFAGLWEGFHLVVPPAPAPAPAPIHVPVPGLVQALGVDGPSCTSTSTRFDIGLFEVAGSYVN